MWSRILRVTVLKFKSLILAAAALASASLIPALTTPVEAKGCLKGMIVGGVAGHYAGHGVVGAVGGCIAGREMAKAAEKKKLEQQNAPAVAPVLGPNGKPM